MTARFALVLTFAGAALLSACQPAPSASTTPSASPPSGFQPIPIAASANAQLDCETTIKADLDAWANLQAAPKPIPTAQYKASGSCSGGETTWFRDADSDGFSVGSGARCCIGCGSASTACLASIGNHGFSGTSGDCNDTNATVNPGIAETTPARAANQIDENCDGLDACFQDADNDNFGTTTVVNPPANTPISTNGVSGCVAASGVAAVSTDCNDAASLINPNATEGGGDEIDQDCDGTDSCWVDADDDGRGTGSPVDPVLPNPLNGANPLSCDTIPGYADEAGDTCDAVAGVFAPRDWRADCDSDGFGGNVLAAACSAPTSPTFPVGDYPSGCANPTLSATFTAPYDCRDAVGTVFPGAPETTGDGIDQDCDFRDTCFVDADNDGVGSSLVGEPPAPTDGSTLLCGPAVGFAATSGDACDDNPALTAADRWYVDCDGDGSYLDQSTTACTAETARTALGLPGSCDVAVVSPTTFDCDDTDAAVSPDLTEVAGNGVDEDCDGVDTCYADTDGDGFGAGPAVVPTFTPGAAVDPLDCDTLPGFSSVNTDACPTVAERQAPVDWQADCDDDGAYGASVVNACSEALAFPSCTTVTTAPAPGDLDCADTDGATLGDNTYVADCDGDGLVGRDLLPACTANAARAAFRADRPLACTGTTFTVVKANAANRPAYECNDDAALTRTVPEEWRADCDADGFYGVDDPPVLVCSAQEAVEALDGVRLGCDATSGFNVALAKPDDAFDCDDTQFFIGRSAAWIADCDGDAVFGADTIEACSRSAAVAAFQALGTCDQSTETFFLVQNPPPPLGRFDCNDDDRLADRILPWYADCDGDGFAGGASLNACSAEDAVALWLAASTTCRKGPDPLDVDGVTRTFPMPQDCDDDDADLFPGQLWYADCDEDGDFGNRTQAACNELGAQVAFGNFCRSIQLTTPMQPVNIGTISAPLTFPVTTTKPAVPDCWDGDAQWNLDAQWRADCDKDGTFGPSTHPTCRGDDARAVLCPTPPAGVCFPPLVFTPFGDVSSLPQPLTDCDDSVCLVRPGSPLAPLPGRDFNCDGVVLCFEDGDADGYGSGAVETLTGQVAGVDCDDIGGFSARGSGADVDCDDTKPEFNPGATDVVANDFDEDCDGFVACWRDNDQDGFGGGLAGCAPGRTAPPDVVEYNILFPLAAPNPAATCADWAKLTPQISAVGGDCDACDDDEFPGQVWRPDCDGDNFFAEATFPACAREDALLVRACANSTTPDDVALGSALVGDFDCLDQDALRYPASGKTCGKAEACERCEIDDQLDDDCNGDVNSAGPTRTTPPLSAVGGVLVPAFVDADGDGFGSDAPGASLQVCEILPGLSANSLDCDDGDVGTRPGAPEVCDFKDQNCNGVSDEAEAIDADNIADAACIVMFRDLDEDGAGDPLVSQCVCSEPRRPLPAYVPKPDDDADPLDTINAPDPLQGSFAGVRYVAAPSDCDDAHADVKPHECNDGIDNDGDGLVDSRDAGCLVAKGSRKSASEANRAVTQTRDPDAVVVVLEQVDGHDNECDGAVPLVELDCDDDGSFPALGGIPGAPFEFAAEIELTPCVGQPKPVFACWGDELDIACDPITGLWTTRYGASDDGFGGRYDGGYRLLTGAGVCAKHGDCDDQCAARCPGQPEACDGVDNDCTLVATDPVEGAADTVPGLPGALETALGGPRPAGTVVAAELDFDGDGYAACDEDFLDGDAEVHPAVLACTGFGDEVPRSDCDDLCYLANAGATEVCNGLVDVCGAPPSAQEGFDADDDGHVDCGAYGPDGAIVDEMIAVPVWVDCLEADTAGPALRAACAGVTSPAGATSLGVVPLVAPRDRADVCDAPLAEAQAALAARLTDAGGTAWDPATATAVELVAAACAPSPGTTLPPGAVAGGVCTVIEVTLLRDDELLAADEATEEKLEPDCAEHPDQSTVRTVWPRARILEARGGVVELECRRAFGVGCNTVRDGTPRVATGAPVDVDPLFDPQVGDSDDTEVTVGPIPWWLELGRFAPRSAAGALMTCWGDPRVETLATRTGGDCDDGTGGAHRDLPEGPYDLVLTYEGENGDCARCIDGIDNNCDGRTDCEDPTCAICFVGQGTGCAGSRDACAPPPEEGTGCATARARTLGVLAIVPLLGLAARRRSRRA